MHWKYYSDLGICIKIPKQLKELLHMYVGASMMTIILFYFLFSDAFSLASYEKSFSCFFLVLFIIASLLLDGAWDG